MIVADLVRQLLDAPQMSTVRIVLETPQVAGEEFHEAKVVWWDDQKDTTFIGDSL